MRRLIELIKVPSAVIENPFADALYRCFGERRYVKVKISGLTLIMAYFIDRFMRRNESKLVIKII